MRIPIKIGDKKYSIKPIIELTTREFIELSKIENLDTVKYIAWQTEIKIEDAFFAVTSKVIEKAIGKIPDITKFPKSKWCDYSKIIETVGQRHQVENSNLEGYELLVFCLAVAQARSNNIDDVKKLQTQYLQESFIEILPAGFFFFKNYKDGKNKERKFLKKFQDLIKIRNLK